MPFLPPNQQRQSTEGIVSYWNEWSNTPCYYYYHHAVFNAPRVGHKDDESQATKLVAVTLLILSGFSNLFAVRFSRERASASERIFAATCFVRDCLSVDAGVQWGVSRWGRLFWSVVDRLCQLSAPTARSHWVRHCTLALASVHHCSRPVSLVSSSSHDLIISCPTR